MKILFLGNHVINSSEFQYCKVLEQMGHTIIRLQENVAKKEDILQHKNIDLFVTIHTHSWRTDGILEVYNEFRKRNVPVISWHLDLYMGLARENEIHEDYFKVDHFFTVDKLMADFLNANTETKGHYLPPASFDELTYISKPNKEKYPQEVIFTGAKHYHPEYGYRTKLIEWLQQTYKNRFAHYGSGGLPQVRGHELNVLYSSAKVVIGDTLCKDFTYPFYFSDRLTSVIGQGGFMIFPYITGLENLFDIGNEIVTYDYNDFEQLKFLIDYFSDNEADRQRIISAGHERVKQEHLFSHRWQTILNTVFND